MIFLWLYLPYILTMGWYEVMTAEVEPEADSKILKFPERLSK